MNSEGKLAESWFIWGLSYYLYYPFISLFVVKFTQQVTLVYLLGTLLVIPFPYLGAKLSRKIGLVRTMELGCVISGIGLILFSFSTNLIWLIISYAIISLFFLGLPSYYSYMSFLGEGVISRVWAISIIPSFFTPSVGGIIATYFGLKEVFFISGIIMILSALPLISLPEIDIENGERNSYNNTIVIPILTIFPIALSFPFIYLILQKVYSMTYDQIGFLATIAEVIGALFTFLYSKINKKWLLSIYLLLFSMLYFVFYNPYVAILFGLWEAIIPSSLEESKGRRPEDFGIINSFQQFGWLTGYLVSYFAFSTYYSILISSLSSVLLSLLIFLKFK